MTRRSRTITRKTAKKLAAGRLSVTLMVKTTAVERLVRRALGTKFDVSVERGPGIPRGYLGAELPALLVMETSLGRVTARVVKLLKTIKSAPESAHLPVILMVKKATASERASVLQAGAAEVIVGSLPASELLARIEARMVVGVAQKKALRARSAKSGKSDAHIDQQTAEVLRQSEERLRLATQSGKIGLWEWDIVHDHVTWTESLYMIHGVNPADFVATVAGYRARIHPDDQERVGQAIQHTLATGDSYGLEYRAVRPDGRVVWLFTNATLIRKGKQPVRLLGACIDITERKRGELAMLENSDRLRMALEAAQLGDWSWDAKDKTISFSSRAANILGVPVGQSCTWAEIGARIFEEDRPRFQGTGSAAISGKTDFDVSFRLHLTPDRFCWVLVKGRGVYGLAGEVLGMQGVIGDITERMEAERAIRDSEERLRTLADNIDQFAWTVAPDGRRLWFNRRFLDFTGLTNEQLADPTHRHHLHHPDHKYRVLEKFQKSLENGKNWEDTFPLRGKNGVYRWFLARALPIRDQAGRISHWLGTHTDITELRDAQEAVQANEHQLRLVTDNAPVYLVQLDHEHRFTFANRPYAARFSREVSEVIGMHLSDLTGKAAYDVFRPHIETALGGRRVEFEGEVPYDGLGLRWMHVIYVPEFSTDGKTSGIVAVIADVTARKHIEQEVERARDQALAASRAKDEFLAALSHELRTPLSPVLLLASEGAANPKWDPEVRSAFETVRKNVELEARLIDDLLDLTRISRNKLSLSMQVQNVRAILDDAIATVRADVESKRIDFVLTDEAPNHAVWGDEVRLQQIFWNILKNAVKFTPEQGRIAVALREETETGRVAIDVTDSGIGLTPKEMERIFEAFVQGDHAATPSSHRFGGVGLGLAISRMLAELHSGSIRVTSDGRNRGATFSVLLPVADASRVAGKNASVDPPAARAPDQPGQALSAKRSILVVDDHEPTRNALVQLLRIRGHRVVSAGTVEEARQAADKGTFDLLVSDIGLPDGSGYDLMSELGPRYGLKGIAISGYGMEQDVALSQASGFELHLTKPVSMQALEQALARVDRLRAKSVAH